MPLTLQRPLEIFSSSNPPLHPQHIGMATSRGAGHAGRGGEDGNPRRPPRNTCNNNGCSNILRAGEQTICNKCRFGDAALRTHQQRMREIRLADQQHEANHRRRMREMEEEHTYQMHQLQQQVALQGGTGAATVTQATTAPMAAPPMKGARKRAAAEAPRPIEKRQKGDHWRPKSARKDKQPGPRAAPNQGTEQRARPNNHQQQRQQQRDPGDVQSHLESLRRRFAEIVRPDELESAAGRATRGQFEDFARSFVARDVNRMATLLGVAQAFRAQIVQDGSSRDGEVAWVDSLIDRLSPRR